MTFVGRDMNELYRDMCQGLDRYGSRVTARGRPTLELTDVHVQLYKPRFRCITSPTRKMSMRYAIGELCHYLDGRVDLESIAMYAQFWREISDDGKTVNSAYGFRLFKAVPRQFNYAVECLLRDKGSRKAVMTIYEPDDARDSKDNPCTLALQLLIRNDELMLFTKMRSEDVWLGVPYDFFFFTIVQEAAYVKLNQAYPELRLGTYFHDVTSFHAYLHVLDDVAFISTDKPKPALITPAMTPVDIDDWFNDLLTFEKSQRGKVLYKDESRKTPFQEWCKSHLR